MANPQIKTHFAGLAFKNPVLTASGTFGNAQEFSTFFNPSALGGVTLKALTLKARPGNPSPRVCETEAGMINSIGLQNGGWSYFQKAIYPHLEGLNTRVIANVAGDRLEDYQVLVERLSGLKAIDVIELNVSCPNVHAGKVPFGDDPRVLKKLVSACCKKKGRKALCVKLSPNVTDIRGMARVCEDSGADGLCLTNTFFGMKIDVRERRPAIAKVIGGYSGPGIKPMVLRMVYEVRKAVRLPLIAVGGIFHVEDALEYLMAGASLVSVGTANLVDPRAPLKILRGIEKYLKKNKVELRDLIGCVA